MTTAGLAAPAHAHAERGRVAVALGLAEAVRMVRHPVMLTGLALGTLMMSVAGGDGPSSAFDAPTTGPTFFFGVFAFFAANLVATRDRRADGEEVLAPVPADRLTRTAGACLGALGPALLTTIVMTGVIVAYRILGYFEVEPTLVHLTQGPLSVLGGALLGVLVARWAPYPGAALVVMVAMVAWNLFTSNTSDLAPLGTYTTWAVYTDDGSWAGVHPGSPGWHDAYLTALCGMAAVGALLRDAANRLPLLVLGAALTLAAAGSGWSALP